MDAKLQGDDEEAYNRQFSRFVGAGIGADDLEALYTAAHAAIRKDPTKKRAALELGYFKKREAPKDEKKVVKKRFNKARQSIEQRKARIRQKLVAKGVTSIKAEVDAFNTFVRNSGRGVGASGGPPPLGPDGKPVVVQKKKKGGWETAPAEGESKEEAAPEAE